MTRRLLLSSLAVMAAVHSLPLIAQQAPGGTVVFSPPPATQQASAPDSTAVFEAASVRPNKSADGNRVIRRQPGGRFNAVNVPARFLVTFAYQLQGFQLIGGPDWLGSDSFDIVAKMEGDPPPMPPGSGPDHMMMAMRALLAERFKLVTHKETRELDIYALVMAKPGGKPGPALKPSTTDCAALMKGPRSGGPPGPTDPIQCGSRQNFGRIQFNGMPLSVFANGIAGQVGRMVIDRTGLTGNWDFELTFAPERPLGALPPGVEPPPVDPNAPTLFTAVQEQLGLKLDATKGPVEVLVIDSIQQPIAD
jgi:uncharacterized protein (TIGR03435 family)